MCTKTSTRILPHGLSHHAAHPILPAHHVQRPAAWGHAEKLERLARFKAIDPIAEKLRWKGQAITHVSLLVKHNAQDWQAAQHALVDLAWKLTPTWQITRLGQDLTGTWSQEAEGPSEPFEPIVSACHLIDWCLDEPHTYTRLNYLQGQAHHW